MTLDIKFVSAASKGADTAAILVFSKKQLSPSASELDRKTGGFLSHALKKEKKFTGELGEFKILSLPAGAGFEKAALVGVGKPAELDAVKAEALGGKMLAALEAAGIEHAVFHADPVQGLKAIKPQDFFARLFHGVRLRAYKFLKYITKDKGENKSLRKLDIAGAANAAKPFAALEHVARGVYFARDLVNEPPNHLYPDSFARRIRDELSPLGVSVEILDEKKMEKLGMGAALAVGQGSDHPPRMVIMRLNGGKSKAASPIAFVGKGITFDTGGVSLKPGPGMEEMKMDMGGAAAVAGLMKALALGKSKANVVGIAAIAENMPSGRAYRPADILKSHSGKTIEVLNTDAEGRLVLADALSYIQEKYKPSLIIDLATLTGAIIIALGHEYCGAFANDEKLWKQLETSSGETGEKLWRMPLDEAWKKEVKGSMTDLQNIGKSRDAGSCVAAGFLEHFIEGNTPWAHLDIAGMAWTKSDQPAVPKFGTGFGVRLLHNFVRENYE